MYAQDGLWSTHNHEFMEDPAFAAAYKRAAHAGGFDYGIPWRVHVALWVAQQAAQLEGDFVECGVGRGFVSSAILEYLPWDELGKHFYLFDTFTPYNPQDAKRAALPHYAQDLATVEANFAEWLRVRLVRGMVPDTLTRVDLDRVAYLHVDMNHRAPETAAVRYLWPRLVPGGWLLLDDYAYCGYLKQKRAMDAVADDLGFAILSLPTGQGLAQKSPASTSPSADLPASLPG
jgi:hypothetical protein